PPAATWSPPTSAWAPWRPYCWSPPRRTATPPGTSSTASCGRGGCTRYVGCWNCPPCPAPGSPDSGLLRMLKAGDRAPSFTLPDHTGKPVSLADFAGRLVVLYFYPKDDTPTCTRQACEFRDHWQPVEQAGAV